MNKVIVLSALIGLFGCASHKAANKVEALQATGDPAHPLFVGHSEQGDAVVAASHFDAMSGTAVPASAVGKQGDEKMICSRQEVTGSHVPKWICRPKSEIDDERAQTQDYLLRQRNCQGPGACAGSGQ